MRAAVSFAVIVWFLLLALAPGVLAYDLGAHRAEIKTDNRVSPGAGATDGREGGEIIAGAFPIPALPFSDAGATCDNTNDYDEACPYPGSYSPDVVYAWTCPPMSGMIRIDLCGSSYDTKVYVYENAYTPGAPYACNDDYYYDDPCGEYVSRIDAMPVSFGATYYIVIDGYGGDCGEYQLEVVGVDVCPVTCTGTPEGEPPLANEYVDNYNGGCGSVPPVFQSLWGGADRCLEFCGVSGWYAFEGLDFRDTDWFVVTAAGSSIEWTVETECPVYMYLLTTDCATVQALLEAEADPCLPGHLEFATVPGTTHWLWVAPITFVPPTQPAEFDYVMNICGIEAPPTSTEASTWGAVKARFK